jgi:hypothetical protein
MDGHEPLSLKYMRSRPDRGISRKSWSNTAFSQQSDQFNAQWKLKVCSMPNRMAAFSDPEGSIKRTACLRRAPVDFAIVIHETGHAGADPAIAGHDSDGIKIPEVGLRWLPS